MRSVGLKTLKNKLSEYVRLAAGGETVLVTDRDRVVAEIGPPSPYELPTQENLRAAAQRALGVVEARRSSGRPLNEAAQILANELGTIFRAWNGPPSA
jgi:antitoxin (DNA-binding transcriptional repressor) of toxin-antitoxin stability system